MIELQDNDLVFAKVRPDAIIPTKDNENAGYDIYANFKEEYKRRLIICHNQMK